MGISCLEFVTLIGLFFEEVYAIPYEKRKQLLLDNKISLWDILESCERDGNSDRTIKNEQLNDLETYLKLPPQD